MYKLKLLKKWKIYDIFHVSLLEQNTTKKRRVNKTIQLKFEAGNDKEYEVERIRDNAIYAMELETSYLPRLYYLVNWKNYPEKENT